MRSHFPIFCLYTRSDFSFMETVKMSFHNPTLPATQTGAGVLVHWRSAQLQSQGAGERDLEVPDPSRTPLNLSRGDHDGRVNHRLAQARFPESGRPGMLSPRTRNVQS